MASNRREEEAKAAQAYRDLKAYLKSKNKNELIRMVFEQINLYQEQQALNKQLHEENQQLKAAQPAAQQPSEAT